MFKILLVLLFFMCNFALANSAPVNASNINIDNILEPQTTKIENKQTQEIIIKDNSKNISKEIVKKEQKITTSKETKNSFSINAFPKDRVISSSSRKINAIFPQDNSIVTNNFPGHRGPNQLVIYTRGYGKTTQTNEFGKEAVVVDDIVVALTGANSNIPRNGYVISGHGNAKKWISDNLKIGTKIEIIERQIKAYTTVDSYRICAKMKIEMVEDILLSTRADYSSREDKYIYHYLKKAKQQYRKSKRDNSDDSLECAKESIKNSSMVLRYTLPFIENEIRGTWIRPKEKSIQEVQKTLDKIKKTGINNIFLETFYHGRTIFPSSVMKEYGFMEQNPEFSNFDALAVWIKEAHRRDIKLHVWFESFYVGNKAPDSETNSILSVKPTWQNRTKQKTDFVGYVSHPQEHNGYFLDPANPEVVEFLTRLINEIVSKYNIDGVNIDYIRYPNVAKENLNNQWGYTPYARQEFMDIYEIDPVEISANGNMWDEWCEYRRDKVTRYIKKVSQIVKSKNVLLSAVIFPDYKISLQTKHQDWKKWTEEGYLGAITPLILTSDDSLAKNMLEEIKKKSNDVIIYPGLFAGFIESDPEDLLKQIHIIRKLKLNGVILFDWAHLNEKYIEVLKTSVFKVHTN